MILAKIYMKLLLHVLTFYDILRIIRFVNLPGLFTYLIIDLFENWTLLKRKIIIYKLILNICVLLITSLVILPASIKMVNIAKQAILISNLFPKFYDIHLREDILGPINMILFLASLAIGLKRSEEFR